MVRMLLLCVPWCVAYYIHNGGKRGPLVSRVRRKKGPTQTATTACQNRERTLLKAEWIKGLTTREHSEGLCSKKKVSCAAMKIHLDKYSTL